MKLTAALIAAASAQERAFADNQNFMDNYETWWNPNISEKYWQNIKDALPAFKTAFSSTRVSGLFNRDMDKLVRNIEKAKGRCDKKAAKGRKRRAPNERLYDFGDMHADMNGLWWQFAKYTRNEFYECNANVDVFKFYKRIDRYRWIYMRHFCNYVDDSADFCSWAVYNSKGEKFDKPFRQMSWFNNKYGLDAPKTTVDPFPLPEGYTSHDTAWGTVYTKIYDDHYTMQEGQALCAADADFLHMPIPENWDQNDFYFNLVGKRSDRDLWLGINDYENEGVWMNDHGNLQTFFNWNGNEPNNYQNSKQDGEDNVEMILSGNDNQNGKWNDMYNHASTQNRVAYGKNNLVVCTFVVPGTEPVTECGYGWEAHETSQGRKCLQVNKGEFKITTAFDACTGAGAELALPRNEEDNRLFADLIGYQKYDLWVAAHDGNHEGTFQNMNDGTRVIWTNWNKNEPNDYGSGEDYVHVILTDGADYDSGRNGLWNDMKVHNHADNPDRIAYGRNNAFICVRDL